MQFPQGEFPHGLFPYEQYARFVLHTPHHPDVLAYSGVRETAGDSLTMTVYYPASEEARTRRIVGSIQQAGERLSRLFAHPVPDMDVLFPTEQDWRLAPREPDDIADKPEEEPLLPYWTSAVTPSCLVVPSRLDEVWGEEIPEKLLFLLYHELAIAMLESDKRYWPDDVPLWADEWQFKYLALWLSQQLDGVRGLVSTDLREEFEESFEPEPDGKTPVTVRGFDWYEDTTRDEYVEYEILLEQFAADLLARHDHDVYMILDFLISYRRPVERLLSDEVTKMLASSLGDGGEEWLENLVYF